MKKILSILLVSLFILAAQAQEVTKPVLLINEFTHSHNFSRAESDLVRNNIIAKIHQSGRVQVVDKVELSKIKTEGEINALNPDYILNGNLESYSSEREYNKYSKKDVYTAHFIGSLKLINPTTGATINSLQLKHRGTGDTEAIARQEAISGAGGNQAKNFINGYFKIRGAILGEEKVKNDKTEIVVIDRGTSQGIYKGTKFKVYQEVDYYGEISLEEIGEIKVDKAVSSSRSICKVTDGEKKIHEFISLGKKLVIVTIN